MRPEFRERVFLPFTLPIVLLVAIFLFAFSLSRVLLAVPELVSTFTALAVAGYVLLVAGLVAARPRISSRALGVGLFIGFVAMIGAGMLSASAGMRELHAEEEHAAGAEGGEAEGGEGQGEAGGGQGEAGGEIPADALVFVAQDIAWDESSKTAQAGPTLVAMDNAGGIVHTLVIDELDFKLEAQPGEIDQGEVELTPGTYVYYCDVPGHREAGMEGQLTVQ